MLSVCNDCSSTCGSACTGFCSNFCTNNCTKVCFGNCSKECVGSCKQGCSTGCESDCVKDCAGSNSTLNVIDTRYDYASSRKTTRILDENGSGYFLYPGLHGNIFIYSVVNNNIYNKLGHVSTEVFDSANFNVDTIRKTVMETLMKYTDLNEFDIKHLMLDRVEIQRLIEDIQSWTWNTKGY